ncbi:hypothetical protein AMAG_18639 [Allomyces macrogynus ATCC 38327]|uniref:Uncharacterized protein n=1 Tax=Allomyces macrogynus (strain ATCC 38327) TaxID=578462 RepID=A0A0L0SGB7_ALLM3|nr:hypothetical protein AMAG_18639 [Allomyces macrogynus ATCC 38327]|eukprot:KNE61487.1 hypothetical protein AMAG_18639 [Allomyces macrogynus ATCC 38327]
MMCVAGQAEYAADVKAEVNEILGRLKAVRDEPRQRFESPILRLIQLDKVVAELDPTQRDYAILESVGTLPDMPQQTAAFAIRRTVTLCNSVVKETFRAMHLLEHRKAMVIKNEELGDGADAKIQAMNARGQSSGGDKHIDDKRGHGGEPVSDSRGPGGELLNVSRDRGGERNEGASSTAAQQQQQPKNQ